MDLQSGSVDATAKTGLLIPSPYPGLTSIPFVEVENETRADVMGRYLEIRAGLKANPLGDSPTFSDLEIVYQN